MMNNVLKCVIALLKSIAPYLSQAIDDIDLALEISEEPCPRAYITKGDALYHLGDFEHALGMCSMNCLK